jgi:hypothetical protein
MKIISKAQIRNDIILKAQFYRLAVGMKVYGVFENNLKHKFFLFNQNPNKPLLLKPFQMRMLTLPA